MTTTITPETTPRRCTMCGEGPSDSRELLFAGSAPICCDCDECFREVFRNHLTPIADSAKAPLDQFMSTIAYETRDDHWVVHLHTFRPGPVIGSRGGTVQALRAALVELTGDPELRLNLVGHEGRGCKIEGQSPSG